MVIHVGGALYILAWSYYKLQCEAENCGVYSDEVARVHICLAGIVIIAFVCILQRKSLVLY